MPPADADGILVTYRPLEGVVDMLLLLLLRAAPGAGWDFCAKAPLAESANMHAVAMISFFMMNSCWLAATSNRHGDKRFLERTVAEPGDGTWKGTEL